MEATIIQVRHDDSSAFKLSEDGSEWLCQHDNLYIERACCSSTGTSGYVECGCGGRDTSICPESRCTGIEEWEDDV